MKKQSQNDPDIVGLMIKIQEQLTALDKKVDSLLGKSVPRPIEVRPSPKSFSQQPVHAHDPVPGAGRPHDHHRPRQMHRATCADCKKECELPFKPSGDRPVYCKECFLLRKTGNTSKVAIDHKPQETPPVQVAINPAINIQEPPAKEKKKPAAAKKSVGKKKLVPQKKKK